MGRPTGHARWGGFAAAVAELGLNRRLLVDDREFFNHGGPELFALYLAGAVAGWTDRGRAVSCRRKTAAAGATYRARREAGVCTRCGGESGGRSQCPECGRRHRAWVRTYKNRLKGGGP